MKEKIKSYYEQLLISTRIEYLHRIDKLNKIMLPHLMICKDLNFGPPHNVEYNKAREAKINEKEYYAVKKSYLEEKLKIAPKE